MTSRTPPTDLPVTLQELRDSGHEHRTVKSEMRANVLAHLAQGAPTITGLVGFESTVVPEVERAIIAEHDFVLLGERGQGKTRLARTLINLLDEWTPVIDGCEINDHPYAPVCVRCQQMSAELDRQLPIAWLHRSERYGEKLATPDTSVGDLIGDIDPIKVAEGRTLGDPETIHFGLVPRTNRGVFVVNELPDLAERIQVSLLNVLEERDIQIRGYQLRLPLDLLLVASANPEDYTSRGRIITPLKDRFGAEISTHYPLELDDELGVLAQECQLQAAVPAYLLEVLARFTRAVRESPSVDERSGVSARFGIAAAESVSAAAARRAAIVSEAPAVARISDLAGVVPTLRGKVEFDVSEEGRELDVLQHLLRRATAETFRSRLAGLNLEPFVTRFDEGDPVETGELVAASDLLTSIGRVEGTARVMDRLDLTGAETPTYAASAIEFALEGLYLTRRLSKQTVGAGSRYSSVHGE